MFEKLMKILFICLVASYAAIANADDVFEIGDKLTTPTSVVVTRKGLKSECLRLQNYENCQLLEINGIPVISEYYVNLDAALPSKFNANVIFATGSTGGNACCVYHYLIDITTPQPLVVKIVASPKPYEEKPVISTFDSGITYENYGDDKGEYGESIWKTFQYKYGSGRVQVLKSTPKYYFTVMEKKKYPYELLDDPVNRSPLIKLMGKSNFLQMREKLVVQGEMKKYPDGIFVGQGCMPHMCGSDEAMFVLDSIKKQAWSIYVADERGQSKVKFFGSFADDSGAIREIFNKWLIEKKMNWSQVQTVNPVIDDVRSTGKPISGGLPPINLNKK